VISVWLFQHFLGVILSFDLLVDLILDPQEASSDGIYKSSI